jgi:hypothetical protein
MRKFKQFDDYREFLKDMDFNPEQVNFIVQQRENYESLLEDPMFYYDSYERDLWYTMNRSGLFENDENNKSRITSWDPSHTRLYITEV